MKKTLKNVGLGLVCAGFFAACTKGLVTEEVIAQPATGVKYVSTAITQQCANGSGIAIDANYKINNNIWAAASDGAGSQCSWYDTATGKWGVNAAHSSGTEQNIKGYPAIARGWLWYNSTGSIFVNANDPSYPTQLSQIQSLTSSWNVTVPLNGEKYNTSYDIWLDNESNPNHRAQYELMIWINYKGPAYNGSDFQPIGSLVASNISVAGHTWNIYRGSNGKNDVFTFRRTTNTSAVTNLDIRSLLYYAKNQGFIQNATYVLGIQAGWEIVAGGSFTTNSFSSSLIKY
jgi:hypothetical protein